MSKVTDAVKEAQSDFKNIKGHRVRFEQVPLAILEEITDRFPDPKPPLVIIEGKENEDGTPYKERNPNDPDYAVQVQENSRKRGLAMMDAMVIMGVELLDKVPADEKWMPKLLFNAKMTGAPDLSKYDLEDPMEREFVFKRFFLISAKDMEVIGRATGVTEEGIESAMDSFPSDEAGSAD